MRGRGDGTFDLARCARQNGFVLVTVGDLVEDVVVWLDGPPQRGTDTPARIRRRRGGSAANVAAFAAAAGVASRFIGQVGEDALGSILVDELRRAGVDVCVRRAGRSGSIVVLVEPAGERTMLPDRGACTELASIEDGWLDDVRVLHVPTYSLVVEPLAAATMSAIAAAQAREAEVSIDVSSVDVVRAFGIERYVALLVRLQPQWLFANEDEHALLAPLLPGRLTATTVVIKRGPAPVVVRGAGLDVVVEVPPVTQVRDTTGAGDAFAAGFLSGRLDDRDVPSCVVDGIELAQRVLRHPGASWS